MKDKMKKQIRQEIENGQTHLGIELGSTRIKAVLIGENHAPLASGSFDWENQYVDQIWTYSQDAIWNGLQQSYRNLAEAVKETYGVELTSTGAIGISAMMHGYMVFDASDRQLTPFRTWRNNITGEASEKLSDIFNHPIPQRWSIAHLYQAILNEESHVADIAHLTTLAGYLHWQLTGDKVLGIGEASGVFPIDSEKKTFDSKRLEQFEKLIESQNYPWRLADLLPEVKMAGAPAGKLTDEGARRLDVTGRLEAGIPFCPPEGDAGTGMVATNSIATRTGNVSAGTSVFAMLVLEKPLSQVYDSVDIVTTPEGRPVAMVHSNNCTSDYDAWFSLFSQFAEAMQLDLPKHKIYDALLYAALEGDPDGGGLLNYGYISGEHITGFSEGRPLFVRASDSRFNLANFVRTLLFSSLGALKTGLRRLMEEENVKVSELKGHGGFFKTREVGQKVMAAATNTPVSVLDTAGEGGAWGIALLAAYLHRTQKKQTLEDFLNDEVFSDLKSVTVQPDPEDVKGFDAFFERYSRGLAIEQSAVDHID